MANQLIKLNSSRPKYQAEHEGQKKKMKKIVGHVQA